MAGTAPVATLVVVYAQDVEKVAAFYGATLGRPVLERASRFVVVGDAALEVAIVRMADVAGAPTPSSAPRVREEVALKPSFLVADLAAVSAAAAASGGGTEPPESAWSWRGQVHLDGHDPEGNRVQFRALPRGSLR